MTAPATPIADQTVESTGGVRSVSFVSLGCPKNLVDSEKMLGLLAESGLTLVSDDGDGEGGADAVVINTCGFLEASKEESLEVIREAIRRKQEGKVKRVVVAGCLVQRHRAKMLEWAPGIDAMVGVFDRDHIVDAVSGGAGVDSGMGDAESRGVIPADRPKYWIAGNALQAAKDRGLKTTGLTVNGRDGKGLGYFESDSARLRLTPRHYAYLRMSEGCNQNCAFCTIPSIRGKMRSKPLSAILEEARELFADGAFEINLIGQDTTSYGDDIGFGLQPRDGRDGGGFGAMRGLPGLLAALNDAVERDAGGRGWIRLMYAYPSKFTEEMIEAIADLPHVVKYIDMPLQHASDRMLTAMRRNVSAEHQRELVLRLRERIPGLAIRTTLITGFPGETEEDHEELLEFVEEMAFEMLGVFEYSREDGTVAGRMDLDDSLRVPAEVKSRRKHEIMSLQQRIAFEQAKFLAADFDPERPAETGHRFDVLIDEALRTRGRATAGVGGGGRLFRGRAYFQAPQVDSNVFVQSERGVEPGALVQCAIVGSEGYDLVARPCDELEAAGA